MEFGKASRYSPIVNVALFASFVAAGSAFIVFAKLYQFSPFVVTGAPVAIMVGYAAMLALVRFFYIRDDQAGDNLYYMGFLFTLTSLAVSLYQFSAGSGAEEIVHNFGIAIASTIAGIALRILFNQMRRDPIEIERASRLELADAARQVKRELDGTALEFSVFRRTTQQILSDTVLEIQENFKNVFESLSDELSELTKSSSEDYAKFATGVRSGLEAGGKDFKDEAQQLARAAAEFTEAVKTMSKRLNDMKTAEEVIEIKLTPTIQGLSRAVNTFSKASDEQIQKFAETLGQQIKAQGTSSDHLAAGVGALAAAVNQFRQEAQQRNTKLEQAIESFLARAEPKQPVQPSPLPERPTSAFDRIRGLGSSWSSGSDS